MIWKLAGRTEEDRLQGPGRIREEKQGQLTEDQHLPVPCSDSWALMKHTG